MYSNVTNHFKGVELFFDLLCEHRCKPVARSDLSATVIVGSGPCVIKLEARAEGNIPQAPLRSSGKTLRAWAHYAWGFRKVVFRVDVDLEGARMIVIRGAWCARLGRVHWMVKIRRSHDGGRRIGVGSSTCCYVSKTQCQ
jgi:hypothetical protein